MLPASAVHDSIDVPAHGRSDCRRGDWLLIRILCWRNGPGSGRIRLGKGFAGAGRHGDRSRLTAVFDGESASVDGIGSIQSGVAVDTLPLQRGTTFRLRVRRSNEEIEAATTVEVTYRNRIRVLADAPLAQTNHVAAAL